MRLVEMLSLDSLLYWARVLRPMTYLEVWVQKSHDCQKLVNLIDWAKADHLGLHFVLKTLDLFL